MRRIVRAVSQASLGHCIGIKECEELAQKLYGSDRASALAAIDRRHHCEALIVADLSNDPSYAEVLYETFGRRVVGLHISRHGDGGTFERRPVKNGAMLIYHIGRSYLLELFHSQLQSRQVRMTDGPESRRAYEQLVALETEMRDSGIVYTCLPGRHDDLGISCAMLAWGASHSHLPAWVREVAYSRRPPKPRDSFGWKAFT